MLFDLRGRRRRAVQATYLMLAVLMGGGLVLFGIGGDASGRPVRRVQRQRAAAAATSQLDKRIERQQERLKASPAERGGAGRARAAELPGRVGADALGLEHVPRRGQGRAAQGGRVLGALPDGRRRRARPGPRAARAERLRRERRSTSPARRRTRRACSRPTPTTRRATCCSCSTRSAAGDKRTAQLAAQKAIDLAPEGRRRSRWRRRQAAANPAPSSVTADRLTLSLALLRCNGRHQGEE